LLSLADPRAWRTSKLVPMGPIREQMRHDRRLHYDRAKQYESTMDATNKSEA
jgi:hypothetical protein